jgi:hypothetical protein
MAWRVGVGLPVDEVDAFMRSTSNLKGKARNLLTRQCKPAVGGHREAAAARPALLLQHIKPAPLHDLVAGV